MLHILTSDEIVSRPDFLPKAIEIIGALNSSGFFHIRTRILSTASLLRLAQELGSYCNSSGCSLVINERVDIALAAEAQGTQLGRGALSFADTERAALSVHKRDPYVYNPQVDGILNFNMPLKIGMSIHNVTEIDHNIRPDWYMAGHVFESASHPAQTPLGLGQLSEIARSTSVPVIAVGGITPERTRQVLNTGAKGVAVISDVWSSGSPKEAVGRYLSIL